ncbi:MAG: hypothetical protein GF334_03720 [Candidatus Altiarchaeales archaeon]|nr:hypothetical protein [Candidatus Altiarchaeales archaeon]
MCGIVGVVQYESKVDRATRNKALRILFSDSMLKTEHRGKDATGMYQVHKDGDWLMTKKGQKVTEWVPLSRTEDLRDPIIYSEIMGTWDEHPVDTTAVVGHCRAATVGSRGKDNKDNHPFAVQLDEHHALLGIHNGTLSNHEVIFKKLPEVLERQGSVDSESIFHFMYHMTDGGSKPVTADMLKYVGQRLEGSYAVIMVNSRFPEQVVTFRKERPMEYFMVAPLNMVFIVSEKKIFEAALEKYNFIRMMLDSSLPELRTCDRILPERDYRIFDTTKAWPNFASPAWKDLDDISEAGKMTEYNSKVLEGWEGPVKSTTYYSSGFGSQSRGTGVAGYNYPNKGSVVKTTKKEAGDAARAIPTRAQEKKDDDVVTTVEMEIPGQEAKAMERAKALGVSIDYQDASSLAGVLGMTVAEINRKPVVEIANLIAGLHFSMGYGAARLEAKKDVEEIRRKAKSQTERLERQNEKQRRAERKIWELRHIHYLLSALRLGDYKVNMSNFDIVVDMFNIDAERKRQLKETARSLFDDRAGRKLIRDTIRTLKRGENRRESDTHQ